MKNLTLYAAVGHMRKLSDGNGGTYPAILLNQQENVLDMQEMTVWSALCWQLLSMDELRKVYADTLDTCVIERRTFENCVARLKTRGLIAEGSGETGFEALYDLLGGLYVVPVSESLPLRLASFLSLTLVSGMPIKKASIILRRDKRDERETQVMALSSQQMLSTAELIKCIETDTTDISTDIKLLDALYVDSETTCDNIPLLMRTAKSRQSVTAAVANLYLRKQIILERV